MIGSLHCGYVAFGSKRSPRSRRTGLTTAPRAIRLWTVTRRQTRKVWFTEGARALRSFLREREREHLLPTDEDWYLCPLCFDVIFTIDELDMANPDLTDEHAPPKWAGGKPVALTCKRCNNDAGRLFDGEAQKHDFERRFLASETGEPMKVAYTVGGVTNYGNLHMSGTTGMLLTGVPAANNPADIERMAEVMASHVGSDATAPPTLQITSRMRVDLDRARLSWIRTAYIMAFAAFGWRYLFQPSLDELRAQLRHPHNATTPILSMTDPDAGPTRRELWVIKEPFEKRSLVVACGAHLVFLPVLRDSRTLNEQSQALVGDHDTSQRASFSFVGDRYRWPTKPYYSLDPTPAI